MKLILLITYLFLGDSTLVKSTTKTDIYKENFGEWVNLQKELLATHENYKLEVVDMEGNSFRKEELDGAYNIQELERKYKADYLMTVDNCIYLLSK